MKIPRHTKQWLVTGLIALTMGVFMCLYSYVSWESVRMPLLRFNAPDEQANYFFSNYFALHSKLSYAEPLLEVSQHFVHPRSMTASNGEVKPVGFLGFSIIYGSLAKLFSTYAIPFFTPIISVLTVLFFYIAVKKLFSKSVAIISSALLLIHPAYWYYSARALFPNILFIDLTIIGLTCIIVAATADRKARRIAPLIRLKGIAGAVSAKKKITTTIWAWWWNICYGCKKVFGLKVVLFFLGGLCIALGLTVRLSESLWIGALLFWWGVLYIRRLSVLRVLTFSIGFAIPLVVLLSCNYALYGNILSSGYKSVAVIASMQGTPALDMLKSHVSLSYIVPAIKDLLRPYMPFILPFGNHPDIYWPNATNYLFTFFWWFTIPTIGGIILVFRNQIVGMFKKQIPHQLVYVAAWACVTAWLVIFYGSWKLTDNINGQVTLGVSYVRYWLPSYIMALPLAASLLAWIYEKGKGRALSCLAAMGIIVAMAIASIHLVFWGGQESLTDVVARLQDSQAKAQGVYAHTPSDAVIFSERSDKIFFPERNVAGHFADFPETNLIGTLIAKAPVYYYGLWDQPAAGYISHKYFEPIGIRWEFVANIAPRENLYRLVPIH